jgi:3-oxoacyl-[acyl-carrier protein] reductase
MMDRTIVVSGGSRGLGLAMVRRLLACGARVATFSRRGSDAIEQLGSDPTLSSRLFFKPVDATDSAAVAQFVADVGQRFGHVDGLVNNAGIARDGVLALMSDQAIREVIDINLVGTLVLTRECVRLMLLERGAPGQTHNGRIVTIASIVGLRGYSGLAAYSATKAGLIGMTASLARELGPRNITVNAVAPGYLATEMSGELNETQKAQIVRRTPLGRMGLVEDVVGVVEFLLSDAAGFMTGQTLVVDGGISC